MATTFRRNDVLERLRALKAKDPDRYAKLRPQDKLSLGYYEAERERAAAAGVDVDGDAA